MFPAPVYPPPIYPGSEYPGSGKPAVSGPPASGLVNLYPPALFPASAYPGAVFVGSAGSSSPNSPSPVRIYPGSLFPPELFPAPTYAGSSVLSAIPTPPVATSFQAAIGNTLVADSTLMSMLGSTAGVVGAAGVGVSGANVPQKVWGKLAKKGTEPPWVVMNVVAVQREYVSTTLQYIESGTLQLSIFATDQISARIIADQAVEVLTTGWQTGSITWTTGRLMLLWLGSPLSMQDPNTAPGAGRLWMEVRQFQYQFNSTSYRPVA